MGIFFSSFNGKEENPKLRFNVFSDVWKKDRLDKICVINPATKKLPEKFYYIDLECVENGEIVSELNLISKIEAPSRAQRLLDINDMLYQTVRPYQKNNFLFNKSNDFPTVASTGYAQIRSSKNNIKYIFQLLHTDNFVVEAMKRSTGTGYPAISSSDLAEIEISYPSLPEQQKIADFLSLVDARIEKQRRLVESLKKYKRGLFLKLYNDSEKSITLFKNIYKMASEGGTPSTSDSENYENGKIPFIKIDDLNQHYLNFSKYFITEKGLKKSSAWIVPENSIIYSNGATIGACSINKIPVTTKQGILGIVPKSNFSVEFLYFFFTSSIFKQKIRAITTKGTMDCAYLKDINGIKISIPDFIAQQKIAKIMVDFENLIERTELSFIYLQNIKKALLQQMFI